MNTPYDAIIVGARCAGSPTAMLLARKGYRVLWSTARRSRAIRCPRTSCTHWALRPSHDGDCSIG